VPLQHNLYFGGQMYTICQADAYTPQGFRAAREAAKARAGPAPATRAEAQRALPTGRGDGGRGGGRGGGPGGRGSQAAAPRRGQRGSANAGAAAMAAAGRQMAAAAGGGGGQLRSERSQWMTLIELLRKK
jgi:antiviral helicase SKI2